MDVKIYPGIWQFVTGNVKGNENAVDAALRELYEETGIVPIAFWSIPYLNTFYDQNDDTLNLNPMFAAQASAGLQPKLSNEHVDYEWFSIDEAGRKLVWPGQRKGLQLVHEYILKGEPAAILKRIR